MTPYPEIKAETEMEDELDGEELQFHSKSEALPWIQLFGSSYTLRATCNRTLK